MKYASDYIIQMSRRKGIGEEQDPPRKLNRSTTPSPRTSTLSQTIQIITNKFRLSPTSPKLRRLRRKVPYDRVDNNQQELSQAENLQPGDNSFFGRIYRN